MGVFLPCAGVDFEAEEMMGDMGDDFRAWREHKNKIKMDRAAQNRLSLFQSGFEYERKDSFETHFHVLLPNGERVSFWPSSGAWRRHIPNARTMYGWKSLIKYASTQTKEGNHERN